MFSSKVSVQGVKEYDVHFPEHEEGLDGDSGEEVDGGLVEEEVVGDARDQGQVASTDIVELRKSYITYLLQNILRKFAETTSVNSIEHKIELQVLQGNTSQEKGSMQVCEKKGRETRNKQGGGSS